MNYKIKIIRRPEVSDLDGEKVMIDFETGKYYMLKGVANDIWDLMDDEITINDITDALLKVYEVDLKTCFESVKDFLDRLEEKGFVQMSVV